MRGAHPMLGLLHRKKIKAVVLVEIDIEYDDFAEDGAVLPKALEHTSRDGAVGLSSRSGQYSWARVKNIAGEPRTPYYKPARFTPMLVGQPAIDLLRFVEPFTLGAPHVFTQMATAATLDEDDAAHLNAAIAVVAEASRVVPVPAPRKPKRKRRRKPGR